MSSGLLSSFRAHPCCGVLHSGETVPSGSLTCSNQTQSRSSSGKRSALRQRSCAPTSFSMVLLEWGQIFRKVQRPRAIVYIRVRMFPAAFVPDCYIGLKSRVAYSANSPPHSVVLISSSKDARRLSMAERGRPSRTSHGQDGIWRIWTQKADSEVADSSSAA